MNISTTNWPAMAVPNAFGTRHSRLGSGCMFNLGLSIAYKGPQPEVNWDRTEASR